MRNYQAKTWENAGAQSMAQKHWALRIPAAQDKG